MRNRLAIRWPLWIVLNVPVALILVVSAVLIGFLGIQNGRAVASDLTKQLLDESADRVQQNLDSFFDTARLLNEQNVEAVRLHQLDLSDFAALQRRFLAELRAYPMIQDVVYGSEQRELAGAWRNVWGAAFAIGEQTTQSNFTFHSYEASPSGEHGRLLLTINANDFRPRTWYQAAMQAGHLTWTPVYTWVNQLGIAVDAVKPVYDDSGALLGVLATSLNPATISEFLQKIVGEQNIKIFIVDDEGLLVASSTMPQPYAQANGVFQRFGTLNSSDPFIQSATQQVGKQFGGWSAVESSQEFEFEQAGENSLAQVTPYQGTGSQWRIVVATPKATYVDPINQHIGQTLLLICVSLIASVSLLTFVSQRITRPILRLSQASKAFAAGNWSEQVPVSRQGELGELATSFNQMADQLHQSTLALQGSEARLRAIFENSAEAITVTDKNGFVTYNPAFQTMFKCRTPDALIGEAALSIIAPDERARIAEYIHQRASGDSAPSTYETRGLRQDGSEFDMDVRASAFVQNGELYSLALLRDISERKQTESAVRASEQRYRLLVENIPAALVAWSPDIRVILNNQRASSVLRLAPDELADFALDGTATIYCRGDGLRLALSDLPLNVILASEEPLEDFELGVIRPGHPEQFWLLVNGFPVFDEQHHVQQVVMTYTDITERKAAAEALRQSEQRYRQLVENLHVGVYVRTPDGRVVLYNRRATELLGLTDEQIEDPTAFPSGGYMTYPDGSLMPDDQAPTFHVLATGKPVENVEVGLKHPLESDLRWALVNAFPTYDEQGQITHVVVTLLDVSERKAAEAAQHQSEARFRNTFEQAAVGIVHVAASDRHFLLVNQRFCDMLGYSQAEMLTKSFQDITYLADRDTDNEKTRELLAGEINTYATEKRFWRKDQTIQWCQRTVSLVTQEDGRPDYFIVVMEDITERKQAEDDLLKASRTLALLSEVNQAIVRIRPLSELFERVCSIAVETGGFRMAWIGLLDSETQQVNPVAWNGVTGDYLRSLDIALVDEPRGHGPTATALRTGKAVVVQDIEDDPSMTLWRADALQLGCRASVAFPLKIEGKACGVLNLYAAQPNFFNEQELTLLSELGDDISFAMDYAAQEQQRFAAEQALKDSEARFRTIIEAAPIGIAFSRDGLVLYENSRYLEMFGYQDPDEVNGHSLVHQIALQNRDELLDRTLRRERGEAVPAHYETMGLRKDGSQFPFEIWLTTTEFADGRANVGFHVDLTERKRADEALRESEARYRQLVENMPAGLIVYDSAARVIFANQRADSVLRLSHEQIMAYSAQRGTSIYTREDGSPLPVSENPVYRVLASGEVVDDVVVGINRHDLSETIWLLETIYPVFDERHEVEQVVLAFTDITQRKHAEQALRQNQAMLEAAFTNMQYALDVDLDGMQIIVNRASAEMFGYDSPADFVGVAIIDTIAPGERQRVADFISRRAAGLPAPIHYESRGLRRDGSEFDMDVRISSYKLDSKFYTLRALRDITEEKRLQRAERQERELAEALLDSALAISSSIDLKIVLRQILQNLGRVIPHQAANIMLIEGNVARPMIWDGYDEQTTHILGSRPLPLDQPSLKEMLTNRTPLVISDTSLYPGWVVGSQRSLAHSYMGVPIQTHGIITGFLSVDSNEPGFFTTEQVKPLIAFANQAAMAIENAQLYDQLFAYAQELEQRVNERTAALEQRNLTLTSLHTGALEITSELDVPTLLPGIVKRAVELLKADRGGGIYLYDPERDVLTLEAVAGINKGRQGAALPPNEGVAGYILQTGQPLIVNDYSQWNRHATVLVQNPPSAVMGVPLLVRGQVAGALLVIANSQERTFSSDDVRLAEMFGAQAAAALRNAQLYTAAQQALAKEKELNELKSRFVSMASHEFRTPLATILAFVETLSAYRHKLENDEIEDLLAKIKDQVGHLKDIMEDVLLLARMQARRVQFNPDLLNLDAFCRGLVAEFQSRPDIKHRLIYSGLDRKCEAMLDRKLMRQIISNLLSNAIKYSSETKPISLELECTDSTIVLRVQDEGIGIPEADQPYLFEPFHRAENVGTIPGTGLGLVITKESVELHGGTIAVNSQLGVGTTLTIHIPIHLDKG